MVNITEKIDTRLKIRIDSPLVGQLHRQTPGHYIRTHKQLHDQLADKLYWKLDDHLRWRLRNQLLNLLKND